MEWKDTFICADRARKSTVDAQRQKLSQNFDQRTPFESDYGRVVFSSALRRLHDKTQVFPLTTNDNIHSRLTHSMEVMNIGHSFAIYLCNNEKFKQHTGITKLDSYTMISPILKSSCFVHDIGNPPFGHFGENVIQTYFRELFDKLKSGGGIDSLNLDLDNGENKQKEELLNFLSDSNRVCDYTQFDGNAEGLRVLSKLQYLGDLYGLNLTYATLGASIKYPNFEPKKSREGIGKHKHGVFTTEAGLLDLIAVKCHTKNETGYFRHPLSFIMEAADSICYLIMDMEDGIKKKWLSVNKVISAIQQHDDISEDVKKRILDCKEAVLNGSTQKKKTWIAVRTALLNHLMAVATQNFVNNLDKIERGDYHKELIEDNDNVYVVLKAFSKDILKQRDIVSLEITGESVIRGLLDAYLKYMFHKDKGYRNRIKRLLSESIFKTVLHEHLQSSTQSTVKADEVDQAYVDFDVKDFSAEERFRLMRDYVACMTDKFALNQYQKLCGNKL